MRERCDVAKEAVPTLSPAHHHCLIAMSPYYPCTVKPGEDEDGFSRMGGKWEEGFLGHVITAHTCPMQWSYLSSRCLVNKGRGKDPGNRCSFPGLHLCRSQPNPHSWVEWCSVKEPEGVMWQE